MQISSKLAQHLPQRKTSFSLSLLGNLMSVPEGDTVFISQCCFLYKHPYNDNLKQILIVVPSQIGVKENKKRKKLH